MTFVNTADSIAIVGQNGRIKKKVYNTDKINYKIKPNDTYVRTVAYNSNSRLYMNPIVRYDGKKVPLNADVIITQNGIKTWGFRILMVLFSFSLLLLTRKIIRR
ncbi:MAG: hypothetical protein JKY09_09075 [Crocinitomicaceae bacterium]|nr:hypothetical protein [Crocinitomicaceae bacterium]